MVKIAINKIALICFLFAALVKTTFASQIYTGFLENNELIKVEETKNYTRSDLIVIENISFFVPSDQTPSEIRLLSTRYPLDPDLRRVFLNDKKIQEFDREVNTRFLTYKKELTLFPNDSIRHGVWNNLYIEYWLNGKRETGEEIYERTKNINFYETLYFKTGAIYPDISVFADIANLSDGKTTITFRVKNEEDEKVVIPTIGFTARAIYFYFEWLSTSSDDLLIAYESDSKRLYPETKNIIKDGEEIKIFKFSFVTLEPNEEWNINFTVSIDPILNKIYEYRNAQLDQSQSYRNSYFLFLEPRYRYINSVDYDLGLDDDADIFSSLQKLHASRLSGSWSAEEVNEIQEPKIFGSSQIDWFVYLMDKVDELIGKEKQKAPKLRLVFVPIGYSDDEYNYFKTMASRSAEFFVSISPLEECKNTSTIVTPIVLEPSACNIRSCSDITGNGIDASENCQKRVQECAEKEVKYFEKVIGICKDHSCGRNTGICGAAADIPATSVISNSFICDGAPYYEVVGHELGHAFGLYHVQSQLGLNDCTNNETGACRYPNADDCNLPALNRSKIVMAYCPNTNTVGPAAYAYLKNNEFKKYVEVCR